MSVGRVASSAAMSLPRRACLPVRRIVAIIVLLAVIAGPVAQAQEGPGPVPLGPWERAEVPSTPAGIEIWDVVSGGPGFIAVGGGFEDGADVGTAAIWVSEDGRLWQSVPLVGDAAHGIPRAIAGTDAGFVAVGSGCCPDESAVWLSEDGLAWERLPDQPGFEGSAMLGVASTPGGIVAVGCRAVLECSGGFAWTSNDGRSWAEPGPVDLLPLGVASTTLGPLAVGSSEAVGGSASLSLSADGTTWPAPVSLGHGGALQAAVEGPAGIVAVGGTSDPEGGPDLAVLASSADGLTWLRQPVPSLRGVWLEDVADRGDGLLLVGWQARRGDRLPAALWTTDLSAFDAVGFPRETKPSGVLHAAAFAPDGTTAVAVGSTVLNRGVVPTIWVSVGAAPD